MFLFLAFFLFCFFSFCVHSSWALQFNYLCCFIIPKKFNYLFKSHNNLKLANWLSLFWIRERMLFGVVAVKHSVRLREWGLLEFDFRFIIFRGKDGKGKIVILVKKIPFILIIAIKKKMILKISNILISV